MKKTGNETSCRIDTKNLYEKNNIRSYKNSHFTTHLLILWIQQYLGDFLQKKFCFDNKQSKLKKKDTKSKTDTESEIRLMIY